MPASSFVVDAVISKTALPAFAIDAVIAARSFTIDAWIIGERWKHHRVRDHFGPESDLYVVLSEKVGKYEAFTPIHWVLADMAQRLVYLEDYTRTKASFSVDAWISDQVIVVDAVIKRTISGSLLVDAVLSKGGVFTVDACIAGIFTINAFIV